MFGNTYKTFLAGYAIFKDLLMPAEFKPQGELTSTRKYFALFLTTLSFVIILILVIPFALFRLCLLMYLHIRYGNQFGGFLKGEDLLFETYKNKIVFNVIIILTSEEPITVIYENVQKYIKNIHNSSYKFSCIIKQLFGYSYYLKDQIKFNDLIENIKYNTDQYISRDMLYNYLEEECNTIRKNQMWRIVFFSQPIKWSVPKRKPGEQYAAILTFRHSLGDGPTVASILRKHLLIEENDSIKLELAPRLKKAPANLKNAFVYRNILTANLDKTLLKIPGSTSWYIATHTEATIKYIPLIKKIKKALNVGFSDVLGAAVCASVSDYIIQRNIDMESFTMASVVRVIDKELLEIINGTYNFKTIINNSGVVTLNVPVKNQTMQEFILYLHKCRQIMNDSIDFYLAYGFVHCVFRYMPIPLIRILKENFMSCMTVGFTNMTGFPKSSMYGIHIEDMFCCTPKFLKIGFTFSVLTYDKRLQLSVTTGEGYVHNRQELQSIIDNVFKKIDTAAEEIFPLE